MMDFDNESMCRVCLTQHPGLGSVHYGSSDVVDTLVLLVGNFGALRLTHSLARPR